MLNPSITAARVQAWLEDPRKSLLPEPEGWLAGGFNPSWTWLYVYVYIYYIVYIYIYIILYILYVDYTIYLL